MIKPGSIQQKQSKSAYLSYIDIDYKHEDLALNK